MNGLNRQELELQKNWDTMSKFLSQKEQLIVGMRLGFWDGNEYQLEVVGRRFNITREWVRTMILIAYKRAKSRLKTINNPSN